MIVASLNMAITCVARRVSLIFHVGWYRIEIRWAPLACKGQRPELVGALELSSPRKFFKIRSSSSTLPMDGHWKFRGGGGSQRPKFLKESMKLNWNFWRVGGGGVQSKKTVHGGGMDIFWNRTFSFLV